MALTQPLWILENSHVIIFAMTLLCVALLLSVSFSLTAHTFLTAVHLLLPVFFSYWSCSPFPWTVFPPTSLYPFIDCKMTQGPVLPLCPQKSDLDHLCTLF